MRDETISRSLERHMAQLERSAYTSTLSGGENTRELESADGESRIQPQSSYSAASGREV